MWPRERVEGPPHSFSELRLAMEGLSALNLAIEGLSALIGRVWGHLDTDINDRGNDYDNDVITDGLATKGFSHQRLVFLHFFPPPPKRGTGGVSIW